MPSLEEYKTPSVVKLLLIGDSTSGKTGACASLAAAGYKLRVMDLDNKLDILRNYLLDPTSVYRKKSPDCHKNVHFVTITDEMRTTSAAINPKNPNTIIPVRASVWSKATNLLMNWKDGNDDFGPITSWGPDVVLVIDSLSMLASAAQYYHLSINGALGKERTSNEWRRDIGNAQEKIRGLLELLKADSIRCNVVLISHITSVNELGTKPVAEADGTPPTGPILGYPSAIGRALSPKIPQYFPNMAVVRVSGVGAGTRRKICTQSQMVGESIVSTMSSAPLRVKPEYDLEWGLAEYFNDIKGST